MLKKIVKNTSLLSSGTFTSRVLGFIRDVLIAKFYGTSAVLEAFIVAFRIPNLLRSLFGEGFSDSVAVPVLSEYSGNTKKLFATGNKLFSLSVVSLSVIALMGVIFSKYLVICIAPGFIQRPAVFSLTVVFVRITFIYLFLVGVNAQLHSLLYVLKRFAVPSFSPCILNLSFIAGVIYFGRYLHTYILVVCVVIAGVLEFFFAYYFLRKKGFRFSVHFRHLLDDATLLRMLRLFGPRVWSAAVYQLNVFVDTVFSSLSMIVGAGAMAAVYYANRIIQFPLALVALSVSRVAMVDFSRLHKEGNMDDFRKLFLFSFRNILFFIIPASIILLFLSRDIIRILFMRGEFSSYSLTITSSTLLCYAWGLLFFCGIKLFVYTFYALKDTRTPAKVATLSLVCNAALNVIFTFPFFKIELGVAGIALASSVAAALNFTLLFRVLKQRIGGLDTRVLCADIVKLMCIGVILAITSRFLVRYCHGLILTLFSLCTVNALFFLLLGAAMRLPQAEGALRWIKNLKKR